MFRGYYSETVFFRYTLDSDDDSCNEDDYEEDDLYVDRTVRTLEDGSCHFTNQAQGSGLLAELASQRETGAFLDVVLQVDSREFPCHRAVLASTPYFKTMLSSNLSESSSRVIQLREIDSNSFSKILDFLYTGEILIGKDDVQDILKTAHMLQLDKIVKHCREFIEKNLCPSNCLGVMRLADHYGLAFMKSRAIDMALSSFPDITQDEEFFNLSVQELTDLLGDKDLQVINEEDVVHSVIKWLDHVPEKPKTGILNVLHEIRLSCVRVSVLQKLESHPVIQESAECLAKITAAKLEKHLLGTQIEGKDVSCPRRPDNSRHDHLAIIVGGWKAVGAKPAPLQSVICFEPDSQQYYHVTTLPTRVSGYMSVASSGRHLYVTGGQARPVVGQGRQRAPSRKAFQYDFPFGTWQRLPNMPFGRAGHQSVVVDGKLFVVGGDTEAKGTNLLSIDCYDPRKGVWMEEHISSPFVPKIPTSTSSNLTIAALGDILVFISLSEIVDGSQPSRRKQKLCVHSFNVKINGLRYTDTPMRNSQYLEDVDILATAVNNKLYIRVGVGMFDPLYVYNGKQGTLTWGKREDWKERLLRAERKDTYPDMDVPKGTVDTITDTIRFEMETSLPFALFGHSFLQTRKSRIGWYCRDLVALEDLEESDDESIYLIGALSV